jgi:hypothetical protein
MSQALSDIQAILRAQIAEHRRLLATLDVHQGAVRTLNLQTLDESGRQQELARQRIAQLEARRRIAVQKLAIELKIQGQPAVAEIVEKLTAPQAQALNALRDELRGLIEQIQQRTRLATRVVGSVLGHLNTVVRVFAGAAQQAGVYTKTGVPKVGTRIGVMEAVG